jgi:signal transduction histidine kinase
VARIIAHEIKNPLTNINLSLLELRTIMSDPKLRSQEDPEEFLSIIDRNGKRINTLIDDLLNATRFDTMTMKEVYLDEVLSETLTLIQDRIKLKDIRVEKEIHKGVAIKGDKEKLVIALLNILVNAVEAVTERMGQLQIATTQRPGSVEIIITDNGKGIPQENLSKLFEPFFTSKKGGTGLGLTATYNIITKHDGAVRVSSIPGKGTSFIVTLPVLN